MSWYELNRKFWMQISIKDISQQLEASAFDDEKCKQNAIYIGSTVIMQISKALWKNH